MSDVRIEFTCPGCQKAFLRPAGEQGQIVECPNCGGWVDVPDVGRPPTAAEAEEAAARLTASVRELQTRERTRQQELIARQIEQAQRYLDQRDRQGERVDDLLERMGNVITRWEQLAEQMGRVIERVGQRGHG